MQAWQQLQQPVPPAWRTFTPWGKVTTLALAGVTKAHGQAGKLAVIIKQVTRNSHPLAQPVTRHIVKRQAFCVGQTTGCLACNENARLLSNLENWQGPKWQIRTKIALANLGDEGDKILSHADQSA